MTKNVHGGFALAFGVPLGAIGAALMKHGSFGLSPFYSVSLSLFEATGRFTMGTWNAAFQFALILLLIVILRKLKLRYPLSFAVAAVSSMILDAANAASMLISCAKIVNGLSSHFRVRSVRNGEYGEVVFAEGKLVSNETGTSGPDEKSGTLVEWIPDGTILPKYTVVENHVIRRIRNCAAANPGMAFFFNGRAIDAVEPKSDAIEHGSRNI